MIGRRQRDRPAVAGADGKGFFANAAGSEHGMAVPNESPLYRCADLAVFCAGLTGRGHCTGLAGRE
jgi:hypothetical protein